MTARPLVPMPMPWAQGVMAAADGLEVPEYGSEAFHALPLDSPARAASAIRAAEVWRYEQETLAHRLRVEIDAAAAEDRRAWLEEEEAGYKAIADSLPRSVFRPAPAPFADARPVRQTDDWPTVTMPGRAKPRGLPSTAAMIRRVS